MTLTVLGIDIGKSTFHLCGLDAHGKPVLRKQLGREPLMRFMAKLPPCLVGMEACAGSQHLARRFAAHGHEVRLMAAQFVKPYLESNKSDGLDAEAIAEAVTRPTMRFVPVKTVAQQDVQALHRVRSQLIRSRTALVNQMRAFLLENGLTVAPGIEHLRSALPVVLEDADNALSAAMRTLLRRQREWLEEFDTRLARLEGEIDALVAPDDACQRLMRIPGIGPIIASALTAAVGNGSAFGSGRALAAWLGIVPRQYSTGGKPRLLGISKRGNAYLRTMLIHGARSLYTHLAGHRDRLGDWARALASRAHANVVVVALANKLARIAWAVLRHGTVYRSAALAA